MLSLYVRVLVVLLLRFQVNTHNSGFSFCSRLVVYIAIKHCKSEGLCVNEVISINIYDDDSPFFKGSWILIEVENYANFTKLIPTKVFISIFWDRHYFQTDPLFVGLVKLILFSVNGIQNIPHTHASFKLLTGILVETIYGFVGWKFLKTKNLIMSTKYAFIISTMLFDASFAAPIARVIFF